MNVNSQFPFVCFHFRLNFRPRYGCVLSSNFSVFTVIYLSWIWWYIGVSDGYFCRYVISSRQSGYVSSWQYHKLQCHVFTVWCNVVRRIYFKYCYDRARRFLSLLIKQLRRTQWLYCRHRIHRCDKELLFIVRRIRLKYSLLVVGHWCVDFDRAVLQQ